MKRMEWLLPIAARLNTVVMPLGLIVSSEYGRQWSECENVVDDNRLDTRWISPGNFHHKDAEMITTFTGVDGWE